MRKVHLYFLGTSRTNNSVLEQGCFYPTVSQPDLWDTGTPTIGTRTKPGISQARLCGHKEIKGEGGREKEAASTMWWGPIHAQAHGDTHGCTGEDTSERWFSIFLSWDEWDPANLEVCLRLDKAGKQWTLQEPKQLCENRKIQSIKSVLFRCWQKTNFIFSWNWLLFFHTEFVDPVGCFDLV